MFKAPTFFNSTVPINQKYKLNIFSSQETASLEMKIVLLERFNQHFISHIRQPYLTLYSLIVVPCKYVEKWYVEKCFPKLGPYHLAYH